MKNPLLILALAALAPLQVLAQAPQAPTAPVAAPQEQPENALKYLQQAGAAFKGYAYAKKGKAQVPPEGAAGQRAIEQNAAVFPLLERAVSLPLRFEAEGKRIDPMSPSASSSARLRAIARLLVMRALVQQEAGDVAGALRSGMLCVRLGLKLQEDGGLGIASTGYAAEASATRGVIEKLAPQWDAAMLKSAARALGEAEATRPNFALALASSREASLEEMRQAIREMFQFQELAGRDYDNAAQERLLAALRQAEEQDDEVFNRPFALTRGLNIQQEDEEEDEDELLDPLALIDPEFDAHAWADTVQKTARPFKHNTLFNRTRAQTESALLQAALAARAYQIEHKTPPASLQVLVPDYLPAVPDDPFEAGAPLQFKSGADGLKIYSVGPDGLDDGGRPLGNLGKDGQPTPDKAVDVRSVGDILAPAELLAL